MELSFDIDQLEADLGQAAALRVLANCGGQRRYVPLPARAMTSSLARELGIEVTVWLAARHGGGEVSFPSRHGRDTEAAANALRAAILEAGLTQPSRSANDIAKALGRSERRVRQVRAELRRDRHLPLFDS